MVAMLDPAREKQQPHDTRPLRSGINTCRLRVGHAPNVGRTRSDQYEIVAVHQRMRVFLAKETLELGRIAS